MECKDAGIKIELYIPDSVPKDVRQRLLASALRAAGAKVLEIVRRMPPPMDPPNSTLEAEKN